MMKHRCLGVFFTRSRREQLGGRTETYGSHRVGVMAGTLYHSICVCVPRDGAGSHEALVGSHATGMRAITESTGVNGMW